MQYWKSMLLYLSYLKLKLLKMIRILIAISDLGQHRVYRSVYPDGWTDQEIKDHFYSITAGYELLEIIHTDTIHEVIVTDKERPAKCLNFYLIQDQSGRGTGGKISSYNIEQTFDLSEVCTSSGQSLEEFLKEASTGEVFHSENNLSLTRV
jgi:hypothetical protein